MNSYYEAADASLAVAQMLVEEFLARKDDSIYGLLQSDLDADQK